MNNLWKTLILLTAFVAATHCLTCRTCPVSILGNCLFASDTTCANNTNSCFFGEAKFNATGAVTLKFRGCTDSDVCNKTLTGSLFGAAYTSTLRCCESNLCNSATTMQLPLTVAVFTAVLSSLWSL
ncbi:sperm acrosome membrane-associated protein 4-like [Cololabis saira]|uniref:sperm acrosome membrane-associated protein 4-like n=1 Tax=Cololabis saira TaxID=129043 RepID=UPI002AD30D65|nr:sperm acrosome membrane-associated protein 4-like [Cololabis saira]